MASSRWVVAGRAHCGVRYGVRGRLPVLCIVSCRRGGVGQCVGGAAARAGCVTKTTILHFVILALCTPHLKKIPFRCVGLVSRSSHVLN